jgi:hypothetical protein
MVSSPNTCRAQANPTDVNILAAPALDIPGVDHVVAVVCGTGTVGRTIRIDKIHSAESSPSLEGVDKTKSVGKLRQLPLEDVAVARGWGYLYVYSPIDMVKLIEQAMR